jgi:hypothetical protein
MASTLNVDVLGIDGVRRALGVAAEAFDARSMTKINTAIMRPVAGPGTSQPIMRAEYTLQGQSDAAFANEGRTALLGGWIGYSREPKYAARKEEKGGGKRVGIWSGSRRPLFATFRPGNAEHIERADAKGFVWGSRRNYAARFNEGGYQRFDDVIHPGRPIVVIDQQFAREVARAYQRWLVFKLRSEGRSIDGLRVNL